MAILRCNVTSVTLKWHLLVIKELCAASRPQVKLCSNTAKRYWLAMAVDVEGVGSEIGTLPINARSDTPVAHLTYPPQKLRSQRTSRRVGEMPKMDGRKKISWIKHLRILNYTQAATGAWQQTSNIIRTTYTTLPWTRLTNSNVFVQKVKKEEDEEVYAIFFLFVHLY